MSAPLVERRVATRRLVYDRRATGRKRRATDQLDMTTITDEDIVRARLNPLEAAPVEPIPDVRRRRNNPLRFIAAWLLRLS